MAFMAFCPVTRCRSLWPDFVVEELFVRGTCAPGSTEPDPTGVVRIDPVVGIGVGTEARAFRKQVRITRNRMVRIGLVRVLSSVSGCTESSISTKTQPMAR